MTMITIKQASKLVDKAPLTVRRRIYSAPEDKKSTNDKGHLLVDRDYIVDTFSINSNELDQTPTQNDNHLIDKLSKELDSKQLTIDSLNDRLGEANMMLASEIQERKNLSSALIESKQLLIESKEVLMVDQPTVKKEFPLLEVISIGASIVFAGAILFYVLTL